MYEAKSERVNHVARLRVRVENETLVRITTPESPDE